VLLEALMRWLPDGRPSQAQAGLFELVHLPEGLDEAAFVHAAAALGVGVEGLSLHRFFPAGPPGVLLGYGNLPEPAINQGVRLLGKAYSELR
jgi:GntR family transcriptional regulator/MocR family aminotransferase